MTKISFIEGAILPIDKPLNWTSFDVVKKIRYEIPPFAQKMFPIGNPHFSFGK